MRLFVLVIIIFSSFQTFACDCGWGGDFFTTSQKADLVVKVIVTKKIKDTTDLNIKMEVEILQVFKGKESSKKIIVWGDNGAECRPYIDYFSIGKYYYLSLYKYGNEYEQLNCGEMYLEIKENKVIGETNVRKELPQIGEMTVNEFENKLKEIKQ